MNFTEMARSNPFNWENQKSDHLKSLQASLLKQTVNRQCAGIFLCTGAALSTLAGAYAKYYMGMKITFTASILAPSAVVAIALLGIYLILKKSDLGREVENLITLEKDLYKRTLEKEQDTYLSTFNDIMETEYSLKVLSTSAKTRSELTTITEQLKGSKNLFKTLDDKSLISLQGKKLLLATSTKALQDQKDCEKQRKAVPAQSQKQFYRLNDLEAFISDLEIRIQQNQNEHNRTVYDYTVGSKRDYNETAATFALFGTSNHNPLFPNLKSHEQRLEEYRAERLQILNETGKIKSEIENENAKIDIAIQKAYSAALTTFRTELDALLLK